MIYTGGGAVSLDGGLNVLTGDELSITNQFVGLSINGNDGSLVVGGSFLATDFSDETITALKNALGYGDVIVPCGHCGQWGAAKTQCQHCGAPI